MLILIPILIFVALVIVGAGRQNRSAGIPVDGGALWTLHQNPAAGIKPCCTI